MAGFILNRPPQDERARQENVRGYRAWAQVRRYLQSLATTMPRWRAALPGGLPVARRQTRRRLRVLQGRHQGRGAAPVLFERRQSRDRPPPHGHVHRLHRAAPRHRRHPAGQGSGRDSAGGIHHAKQWRLDHVRQRRELTIRDAGEANYLCVRAVRSLRRREHRN